MKAFICLFAGSLLFTALPKAALGQGSYGTENYARQQQEEERWRRLSAQMDDLEKTQELFRNRLKALEQENSALRSEITKAGNAGVSPEEFNRAVKQLTDAIKELDNKRIQDNRELVEKVTQLIKNMKPASTGAAVTTPKESDSGDENAVVYKHRVESGQTLSAIVKAYNAQGVKTSLDAILKANPGLDPRRMKVGDEIVIPKL